MSAIVVTASITENSSAFNSLNETVPPAVRNIGDAILAGTATVPNLARGIIANTGIAFSNSNVFHICEPFGGIAKINPTRSILNTKGQVRQIPQTALGNPVLKLDILLKSAVMQQIIADIRSGIENLLGTASPILDAIKAAATYVASILKTVNYVISIYTEVVATVVLVESYINTILNFIASLPLIISRALSECVALLSAGLANALTGALNINTGGLLAQAQQLSNNIATAQAYTQQAIAGANTITTNISTLGSTFSNNITSSITSVQNSITNAKTSFNPVLMVKVV